MRILFIYNVDIHEEVVEIKNKLQEKGHSVSVLDDILHYDNKEISIQAYQKIKNKDPNNHYTQELRKNINDILIEKIEENDNIIFYNSSKKVKLPESVLFNESMFFYMSIGWYLTKKIYITSKISKNIIGYEDIVMMSPILINNFDEFEPTPFPEKETQPILEEEAITKVVKIAAKAVKKPKLVLAVST